MKRPTRSTSSPRLLSSNELRATTGGGMFSAAVQVVKDALSGGDGGGNDPYMNYEVKNVQVSSYNI